MLNKRLVIGSRGSELALWQTNWVRQKLEKAYPNLKIDVEIIKTTGDRVIDKSLSMIGDKGLFTREIENSLLEGKADIAVHSLKDLPTALPDGLKIGAVAERADQRDVFISKKFGSLGELPEGAKVATGSLRRRSQLLHYRSDLEPVDVRGNITTRLKKLEDNGWDGMILAYAGLNRLSLGGLIKQIIPVEIMLPAVCQGIVAVEIRDDDSDIEEMIQVINDKKSEIESAAERSFLRTLEGGCQVPIGVYSDSKDGKIGIEGMIGSLDGKIVVRDWTIGDTVNASRTGEYLAELLIRKGGDKILKEIREPRK